MSIFFQNKKDSRVFDTETTEPNLNLLAHAQLIELEIGSICGGHGICGKDRIQIDINDQKKFSTPTADEKKHLTTEEIEAGFRLACQCYPEITHMDAMIKFGK